MRIVNVIQRYPPAIGGSETWAAEVCRQLVRWGHEVSVLTLDIVEEEEFWRDLPPERRTLALGPLDYDQGVRVRRFRRSIPVHSVYHGFYKHILDRLLRVYFYGPHSLEMYLKLFAHFRTADVVFLHTAPYPHNLVAWLVAHIARKPVFMVPHFHPDHPSYERWHNYWLLRRCEAVFTVSEFEKEFLSARKISRSRLVVTGNGVDGERYVARGNADWEALFRFRHELCDATEVVLFLGRKMEYKGLADLFAACERLAVDRHLALILVGPSSEWFETWFPSHKSACHGLRVVDLGEVDEDEKIRVLHLADVLALPSRFEAFGIVFLEAWACGTPVVGSDAGAIPSVLQDGGMTAPYGNPARLADVIGKVLDDGSVSNNLVEKGRRLIETRYNWREIARRTARGIARHRAQKARILYVTNFFAPYAMGGAEIVAQEHARELVARGHEVRVFAGRLVPGKPRYALRRERVGGLRVDRVNLDHEDISAQERNHDHPEIALLFAEVMRDFRPHVVHVHNLAGLSVDIIATARDAGIPVVMTLHDYWAICPKNTLQKGDGEFCSGRADCADTCLGWVGTHYRSSTERRNEEVRTGVARVSRFISPSRYLADRYIAAGYDERSMYVIPNGIDLRRIRPRRASRPHRGVPVIRYSGYIGQHKGVGQLIETMADIRGARLVLRGPCDQREAYQRQIESLGLSRSVEIGAAFPNARIGRLLAKTDIVVINSRWPENHPVSVAEAMASGLPVVAPAIGGIPEMVRDGETGFLFEPGDRKVLADRLQQLVDDPNRRAEMGGQARRVAEEEYGLPHLAEVLEGVYEDVIAEPAAHGVNPGP